MFTRILFYLSVGVGGAVLIWLMTQQIASPLHLLSEALLLLLIVGWGIRQRRTSPPLSTPPEADEPTTALIFDRLPEAVIVFGSDLEMLYANRTAQRLFGYTAAQMIGKPLALLFPAPERLLEAARHDTTIERAALRVEGRHSSGREIAAACSLARDVNGYLLVVRDVGAFVALERALRASETRTRQIVQQMGVGLLVVGAEGQISESNPAVRRILGYEQHALTLSHLIDLADAAEQPIIRAALEALGDAPQTLEWRLRHQNGSVINVEATLSRISESNLIVVLLKDVTQERATLRALEERERFIEKIAAVMPASLRAFDIERDVYLFNNHRIAAILGLTTEALGTITPQQLIEARVHPDDQAALFVNRRRLAQSPDGTVVETLYRARHTDGTWRWIRAYDVALARDAQGDVRQIVGVGVDVTEQQETLEKLRERERLLAGIATAIPASIRAYDLKHNVFIYNNNRIARILGLTDADVQNGKPLEMAERIHPDDKTRLFGTSQRLITEPDGTVVQMLYRLRHEDGDYRWLQGYDVVMSRDAEGHVEQIVGIAVDVTEQKRAEEALLERERFIAGIAAAIPASLRVYDHERRVSVYNNGRLRRMLGLSEGEFTDGLIHQRIHPDDQTKLDAALDQLQRSIDGIVVETLYRAQHISGDYVWIHAYDMVMSRDMHGAVKEVIGVDVDVSAEQFMLEALMESEERLQLALTSAYDGWWEWNDADDSMLLSPSLMTIVGLTYNGEAVSTQRWIERVYPDDQRLVRAAWLDLLRDLQPVVDVEYRVQDRAGEWKWIHVRGKVVARSAEGRALRVIGTVTNVTERKQAEAALRQSEARYRLIAENVNDLISRHTIRGDYLYASPACQMLLGYEPEYLIGRRVYDLIHPEDIEHALDAQFRAMNSDEPVITNYRMRHRSGAYIWFETTSRSVRDSMTGDAVEWVCVARDVTMRLQAQEEMLRAERMRVEIEQQREVIDLKQNFVTMVSHEFRTPLAVIITSTEMMERYQEQMSAARRGEHLRIIQTQALHMTQMMEDVLLLSRAQAGKLPFKPAPLDVLALCQRVIDHLLLRDSEAARIQFTYALSAAEYVLDEKLIQQILINLLTNALKYSENVVELEVREDGVMLHIAVRDYGIGISETDQERLYETFHRGANVGTITGTGLGLSIVKYSVERHGGAITCQSAPNAGTLFTVRIPLG